jgi:hypothetical protein
MILINFAHPLTPNHLAVIEELVGKPVERVVGVRTEFDNQRPFVEQAGALVEAAGLSSEEWQTLPLLINLPSHSTIAALVLAELHGRTGYFPAILRMRPVTGSAPPQFELAEVLDLQRVREAARKSR